MLKKVNALLFSYLAIVTSLSGYQSDFITYDWLMDKAVECSYTDHIPHFRRLFSLMKVRGFLECGCGFSTKYFLDNADQVISIEYVTPGYGDMWYQDCKILFADRTNWLPQLYNEDLRGNSFNNACAYQCSMHKDYALIDPTYLTELDNHFKKWINYAQLNGFDIDVAFVDPGVYIRGDLVKLLLANKIPIIVAHDTACDGGIKEAKNLYGWNKVATPSDYIKIHIPFGQGTTFWISKQYPELVTSFISYRDSVIAAHENGKISMELITQLSDAP